MDKFSYIPNFKVLDNLKLWKIRTLFLGKYGDKGIGEYPPKEELCIHVMFPMLTKI